MTRTPSSRARRRFIWIAVIAVLVLGLSGAGLYARWSYAKNARSIAADDLDVRIGKAEVADIQVAVNEIGTIEPLVKVDVKSTLSGKVTELLVREGERVRRGQVLAKVEPDVNQAQELSEVKSGMKMAEIKAQDSRRDLEMNTRLHEEGLMSDQQLKDFRVRFDTASETLDSARVKMKIVEESGIPLNGEISTTQRANIVSPMDGHIIKKNVEVGQTVSSGMSSFNEGTALYTVADVKSMLIKASINEVDIGKVRNGMPVVITVDAFPYRRFDGTVTHISPAARLKEKVKVFDVEVTLKDQVAEFRAGMTANIEIKGDKAAAALGVPVEAIFKKDSREVVYVLKPEFDEPKGEAKTPRKNKSGKYDVSMIWQRFFEERPVSVGLVSLEKAQIVEGVKPGQELALEDPTRPRQLQDDED